MYYFCNLWLNACCNKYKAGRKTDNLFVSNVQVATDDIFSGRDIHLARSTECLRTVKTLDLTPPANSYIGMQIWQVGWHDPWKKTSESLFFLCCNYCLMVSLENQKAFSLALPVKKELPFYIAVCANTHKSTSRGRKSALERVCKREKKHWVLNHLVGICGTSDESVIAKSWNVALNV